MIQIPLLGKRQQWTISACCQLACVTWMVLPFLCQWRGPKGPTSLGEMALGNRFRSWSNPLFYNLLCIFRKNPDYLSWITGGCVFVTMLVSYLLLLFSQSYVWLCNPMNCNMPGFPCQSITISWSFLKFMFTESVIPSTILSSVVPFSSFPQSFPVSGSFPVSQLFTLDGWSFGASASVLVMNIQSWFPLALAGLIFLLSKGLSRIFSITTVRKHQFGAQSCLWSNSHIHIWLPQKP